MIELFSSISIGYPGSHQSFHQRDLHHQKVFVEVVLMRINAVVPSELGIDESESKVPGVDVWIRCELPIDQEEDQHGSTPVPTSMYGLRSSRERKVR
ncbi:uncharacterized protein LOC144587811 isoform X2 [Pogona vitticeps]